MLNTDQEKAVEAIVKWLNSDGLTYTLQGAAGTGKTYTVQYLLPKIPFNSVCVSAPTHKALKVIEKGSKLQGKTIQSLLGLRPEENIENINVRNFKQLAKPTAGNYRLIILDEASMLNQDLFDLLIYVCGKTNTKILFIGDEYQLPPVSRRAGIQLSKVFDPTAVNGISTLRIPARQKEDNPLSLMLFALRADMGDEDSRGFLMKAADTDFGLDRDFIGKVGSTFGKGTLSKLLKESYPTFIRNGAGYEFTDISKFNKNLLAAFTDNYDDNPNYCKYLAYTNAGVSAYNKLIRDSLITDKNVVAIGDRVMGYKTISVETENGFKQFLTNSEEYQIQDVRPVITAEGLNAFQVTIQTDEGERSDIVVIKDTEYATFSYIHDTYLNDAKMNKTWGRYYDFKDNHLIMHSLNAKTDNLPKKDLDYSYGITVHKSQGSTYDEVFVDIPNIKISHAMAMKYIKKLTDPDKIKYYTAQAMETFLRLMYVAFSRASLKTTALI
jgi:exodeoxyribonuclease-5